MHPTDTPRHPEGDSEPLLSIGVFARRVGLAPSALRFYDDCGLLRPARVDAVTGYRSYRPEQERRARLVRRLRDAGLPLVDAVSVLDGPPEQAARILRDHLRTTRAAAEAARAAVEDLLDALPAADGGASARLGGPELAAAVRQVAPAAAEGPVREAFPVLGRVLLELEGDELVLTGGGSDGVTLRAVCTGPPLRVAFDPAVLLPALDAGVGPDALLEIASPAGPVVVRSADQGSFTTLVMPVRDIAAVPGGQG
ncbi:MerR family transcriptional regulator [Streptomyces sp. CA-181903]|uniref:MerR family transcriptional regulator n=1 Tax=Streptomyces sp. CA-181903 TaxID=3240055 RepID=UPI003D915AD6